MNSRDDKDRPNRVYEDDDIDRPKYRVDGDDNDRPKYQVDDDDDNDRPKYWVDEDDIDRPKYQVDDDDDNDRPKYWVDEDDIDRPKYQVDDNDRPKYWVDEDDIDGPKYQVDDDESEKESEQASATNIESSSDDLNKGWLDVFSSTFYFRNSNNPAFQRLKKAIDDYHKIPKTDITCIPDRIQALKGLSRMVGDVTRSITKIDSDTKNNLERLAVRANLKANYIAKLPTLTEEAKRRAYGESRQVGQRVITMQFDKELLKDLDPEKRTGHDGMWKKWNKELNKEKTTPTYFLWLERQDTRNMEKDVRYFYLDLDKKHVKFDKEGFAFNAIFRASTAFFSSPHVEDGIYLYNIGENGELYIMDDSGEKGIKEMAQYPANFSDGRDVHHNIIMGGINVLLAGNLTFKDGKIIQIDNNSGHYRPTARQMLLALQELNKVHPGAISDETCVKDVGKGGIYACDDDIKSYTYAEFKNITFHEKDIDEKQHTVLLRKMGQK